jgi:rhodanese-related sulfurtransferase
MIKLIKKLFGIGPQVDFHKLMKEGATIVDVRSKGEFESGHIRGAINIPLNHLENNLAKIKKEKPVITCCASGMRSASARGLLQSKGYTVYNGGGWTSLKNKINK